MMIKKIKVKFYKTTNGRDKLRKVLFFDILEEAMRRVDEWEAQTPDNYAVYSAVYLEGLKWKH